MADLSEWKAYAKSHKGTVVAWINQAENPDLEAANVDGVCRAITLDWISANRAGSTSRNKFLATIRAQNWLGNLLSTNVPRQYIDKQIEYAKEFAAAKIEYDARRLDWDRKNDRVNVLDAELKNKISTGSQPTTEEQAQLKQAIKARDEAKEDLQWLARFMQGGKACINHEIYNSMDAVGATLDKSAGAQYYALALHGPGAPESEKRFAHFLGFEFRPDRRPPLFGLFDANAGLFQFPSQNDVLDFFAEKLWAAFYKDSYVKGEIDTFALYYYGGEE